MRIGRHVDIGRLTDAGLALYAHGLRAALAERDELLARIEEAEHDLERMLIAMDGTIAHLVGNHLRHVNALDHRATESPQPVALQPWDVPIRQPGTNGHLPPEQNT